MRPFFLTIILSFCMSFTTLAQRSDATKTCANDVFSGHYETSLQDLKTQSRSWQILPKLQSLLDDSSIPKQLYEDELLSLSCGPISMAMSLHLLGEPLQRDVLSWILGFPYFEAGVLPRDLISQTQPSLKKFEPRYVMSTDFSAVLNMVRAEIDAKRPVVTLLVFGATRQHYLTWVGYNDKRELALLADTDGTLSAVPYATLECIMYAGAREDENLEYNLAIASALGYFASLTNFELYNLIKFEPK